MWRRGWNILRVCFFLFFFLTFILAGRLWRSAISSCHTDENGCVRNENPLWRRNPWHLVLFPFFPPPFFISSPSLLLSARRCGVSAQWDHPSINECGQRVAASFLLIFCRWGFFLQVALFPSFVQASVAALEHTVPPVIPNNMTQKGPNVLCWYTSSYAV